HAAAAELAECGRRDDPATRELGPAARLLARRVDGVDQVAAAAGDDLGAAVAAHVTDRRVDEELEVIRDVREARERGTRPCIPAGELVVVRELLLRYVRVD